MRISNNTIAMIFRIIFVIACGGGLTLRLIYVGFTLDAIMSEFVLIVGALTLIYFIYLIIARPESENGILRGSVTLYMILTCIAYYFLYFGAPGTPLTVLPLAGYLLYFAAPILAFLDYLLFCQKGDFKQYCPLLWTLIPVLFNVAIFLINKFLEVSVVIPYFNLFGMNLALTFFTFLGVGYLLLVVDNLLVGKFS